MPPLRGYIWPYGKSALSHRFCKANYYCLGLCLEYIDVDGATRLFLKESATIPSGWEWPIKDKKSWEKIKEERINFNNIRERLPKNWDNLVEEYKNRDYPLALGGYPHGFFGTLAHLLGYDHLFYAYFDKPKLIHDMLETFTELWIAV